MGIWQSKTSQFKQILEEKILTGIYPSPDTLVIKTPSKKPTKAAPQNVQRIALNAEPIAGKNEVVVNAVDGRKQVQMTATWPYSVHGVVACKFNNISKWGTGILIGPNVVLTAGHNLYDRKDQVYADLESLQFLPGINGQMLPFGHMEIEKCFISPNYIKEEKEDFGLLLLKKPIGDMTGYFGLACLESEEIKQKRINITGYPGDKVSSKSNTYEMWGMEGIACHIDKDQGQIHYLIDTEAGQSGSGVWFQEGEHYYVCGVHVSGTQSVNTATLLTRAIYQQIHAWLQQQQSFKSFLFPLGGAKKLSFERQKINSECVSLLMKYNLDFLIELDLSWSEIGKEGMKTLAENLSCPNLSQLDLSYNRIDAEGAKALAKNNSWINLSQLILHHNNINADGIQALAENVSWVNLSHLDLEENNIGAEGASILAQNTSWPNLSYLDLEGNNIGSEGTKALAQNASWTKLLHLDLSWNNIDAEGAKALAQNISWTSLSQLYLYFNHIEAEGIRALAHKTPWLDLSLLSLRGSEIGVEGAKALAQNYSWSNLSRLNLYKNNLGAEGIRALARNDSWVNLSYLDLSYNKIDGEGAKALTQNTSWVRLSHLDLSYNEIDAEGAKALARKTVWADLSQLSLYYNKIGSEGAKAVAENTSWTNLSKLDLSYNNIEIEGAKALAQNTSWNSLSELYLFKNKIESEGAKALKQNKTWKSSLVLEI